MNTKALILGLTTTILLSTSIYYYSGTNQKPFLFENTRPIVGIFTQPSEWDQYPKSNYTYIASSYVKFIEQSGARVVPIPYEADNATLEQIFQSINGIFIPGGGTGIKGIFCKTSQGPSKFTQAISYMLHRAMKANDENDYFPVMAVCLGHEAVSYIFSGYDKNALTAVSGEVEVIHPLIDAKRDSFFYRVMNDEQFNILTTENISYYHHSWAVSPDLLTKHKTLGDNFEITAYNKDEKGTLFIASMQGTKYPIFTTQYHSEKNAYEFEIVANHSSAAVAITSIHSNQFIGEVRKNNHQFPNTTVEYKSLIFNYPTIHIEGSGFTEVYIIDRIASPAPSEFDENDQFELE